MNIEQEAAIELRRVSKRFKTESHDIFRDFSLTARAGEVLAIVGPSGCGKSTLLNLCALVDGVEGGEVYIEGQRRTVAQVGAVSLAYIFQRDALLPWASVLENATLGVRCRGVVTAEHRAQALDYLERFGLKGYEQAYPSALSVGQRQRVAIIQSLLVAPHILLLDEPFASLDFQTKLVLEEELLRVIRGDMNGHRGRTVLVVTHDIEEALVMADRVVVLGRQAGEPAQIVMDMPVTLAASLRHPVRGRESRTLRESFESIWATLKPFVATSRGAA